MHRAHKTITPLESLLISADRGALGGNKRPLVMPCGPVAILHPRQGPAYMRSSAAQEAANAAKDKGRRTTVIRNFDRTIPQDRMRF